MISLLFYIATLICCAMMFIVRRSKKVSLLILGTIILSAVELPYLPFHSANSLLPLCFLISEVRHLKSDLKRIRQSSLLLPLAIMLLSALICTVTSPHIYNSPKEIFIYWISEILFKYFAIAYAFCAIKNEDSIKSVLNFSFIGIIILTLIGIVNLLEGQALFINELTKGITSNISSGVELNLGEQFLYSNRFRVQALFVNPFDYGYICVLMLILHIHGFLQKKNNIIKTGIVVLCCIFGVISCGCRTIIFCFVISLGLYLLLRLRIQKFLLWCILPFAILCFTPIATNSINSVATMFERDSDVEGSSFEMRIVQYATVIQYIQGYELTGRGHGFFQKDLGWGDGDRQQDKDLEGLEGVVMDKLLHQGIIGLVLWLLFYILIVMFFMKKRKLSKPIYALGCSVFALYFIFANMTGELLSVYPTLLVLGYAIKSLTVESNIKKKIEIKHKRNNAILNTHSDI